MIYTTTNIYEMSRTVKATSSNAVDSDLSQKIDKIMDMLTEIRNESRAEHQNLLHRLEAILVTPSQKRTTEKKKVNTAAKDTPEGEESKKDFPNAMYWFAAMYTTENTIINKHFTPQDVEAATKVVTAAHVKAPITGAALQKAVAMQLWKSFTPAKKKGDLKTMYDNWKSASNQKQSTSVATEDSEGEPTEVKIVTNPPGGPDQDDEEEPEPDVSADEED
jgi:hypothetical protein